MSVGSSASGILEVGEVEQLPEELAAALARLDERLRSAVAHACAAYGADAGADPYRGLYVGDADVPRLFARTPGVPLLGRAAGEPCLVDSFGDGSPLARLARSFALEPLDLEIVLVALAPQIDLRYERLYGYLQDDVGLRRPTVDLALNLLCTDADAKLAGRARMAFDAPLLRNRLLGLLPPPGREAAPLLAREIVLDEHIVETLLGASGLDQRLADCARLVSHPRGSLAALPAGVLPPAALAALARAAEAGSTPMRLSFDGRPGSGRTRVAEALSSDLGRPLLVANVPRLLQPAETAASRLRLLMREARLHDAILMLSEADTLAGGDREADVDLLLGEVESHDGIVVVAGSAPFAPIRTSTRRRPRSLLRVAFPLPDAAARRRCWTDRLGETAIEVSADAVDALAGRFRLTSGQIADAVDCAREHAAMQSADARPPSSAELFAAARAQASSRLASLAKHIEPRRRLDDIVLPNDKLEQLREICDTVRRRAVVYEDWGFGDRLSLGTGVNVLFSGPSGTGKTLAAEILAAELELELYAVDLSAVVSKYIGETEKHLERIFTEAETASAVLLFDEADALFGKRSEVKDAHDRHANVEVAFLLQRIEAYDGVVVLATNLARNMDIAFVRRMHFTLEFPLPDEPSRLRIWRGIWPAATPLHDDVDLPRLARQIELSGGHIRNIALAAAFLAAEDGVVTWRHLAHAARREYQKLGQLLPAPEIGS